jgi:hypothetical protein
MRWRIVAPAFLTLAAMASAAQPAVAAPYLQLVGTVAIAGQPTVLTGDQASAYGSDFCGAAACSAVTLRIGDRVAAKAEVNANGRFQETFTVTEDPGRYLVSATQRAADGSTLRDEAYLVVAVGDAGERQPPPPEVRLTVLSARDGRFLAVVRPARSYAHRRAWLQRRTASGRWVTVKRIRLDAHARRRFTARLPSGRSRLRLRVAKGRRGAPARVSRSVVINR